MSDELEYVIRSTVAAPSGRATYTLVDMAGRVSHVTLARELTTDELAAPVLTYAVRSRRVLTRTMR